MPVSLNVIQILSGDAAYSSTSNELYIFKITQKSIIQTIMGSWVAWTGAMIAKRSHMEQVQV